MKKQSGFTLVEGLLIVLILAVIGFAGYYVLNNQKNDLTKEATQNSQQENSDDVTEETPVVTEPDIAANWKRIETGQKAFSLKIADGMSGYNDQSGNAIVVRTYSEDGQPAIIEDISSFGDDNLNVLFAYETETPGFFTTSEKLNLKDVPFSTTSGVSGLKQTFKEPYAPPCEGPGCYVGTEYTNYEFKNSKNGKTIVIIYARKMINDETAKIFDLKADDPDLSTIVDAIAKSLQIL